MAKLIFGRIYKGTNPFDKKEYHFVYLGKSKDKKSRLFYCMEEEINYRIISKEFIKKYKLKELME